MGKLNKSNKTRKVYNRCKNFGNQNFIEQQNKNKKLKLPFKQILTNDNVEEQQNSILK